jgi:hypothetical protein
VRPILRCLAFAAFVNHVLVAWHYGTSLECRASWHWCICQLSHGSFAYVRWRSASGCPCVLMLVPDLLQVITCIAVPHVHDPCMPCSHSVSGNGWPVSWRTQQRQQAGMSLRQMHTLPIDNQEFQITKRTQVYSDVCVIHKRTIVANRHARCPELQARGGWADLLLLLSLQIADSQLTCYDPTGSCGIPPSHLSSKQNRRENKVTLARLFTTDDLLWLLRPTLRG